MKDKIIELVSEKTGLDAEKAEAAVDTVLDYLKENPAELKELVGGEHGGDLRERLGDAKEKIAPAAAKGKEAMGEARERIAPVAAAAGKKAGDVGSRVGGRLRGFMNRDKGAAPAAEAQPEAAADNAGAEKPADEAAASAERP